MQSEADGDAHADGVVTYVEVRARRDNDVSRDLCPPQRSRNRCETRRTGVGGRTRTCVRGGRLRGATTYRAIYARETRESVTVV